jgi:integrase
VPSANVYFASLHYVSKQYAIGHKKPELDFALIEKRSFSLNRSAKRARSLTQREATALILTCGKPGDEITPIDRRDRALIVVALETGMRRMSLEGITFEGLHIKDSPFVKVPIKGPKGRAMLVIPLSDTAIRVLQDWMAWLRSAGIKRGPIFVRLRKQLVFKNWKSIVAYQPEGGISSTSIHSIIAERGKLAGIKNVYPLLFRHTFITWRAMAGLTAVQLSAITGHKIPEGPKSNAPDWVHRLDHGPRQAKPTADDVEKARASTPPWLAKLVDQLVGS